jgi:hypothetical protein
MTGQSATWRAQWERATTFDEFVSASTKHGELWRVVHRVARVPDDLLARARALARRWRLLVLAEDWCGDAVHTVPVVMKLAELAPPLELRLLARDANPEVMDAHLTGASRSIPVVIALDEQLVARGWWGPRPMELQRWVVSEGLALPRAERYRHVREWYARDRGRSTAREVIEMLERAEGSEEPAGGAGTAAA